MRHLIAAILVLTLGTSTNSIAADTRTHSAGIYDVKVTTASTTFRVEVQFYGTQYYSFFYGSGKCSTDVKNNAYYSITLTKPIIISRSLTFLSNDEGSHRSGVSGTCGKNQSLLNGMIENAWDTHVSRINAAHTSEKSRVETTISEMSPNQIESFLWRLR